jgi:cell division protein FtsL
MRPLNGEDAHELTFSPSTTERGEQGQEQGQEQENEQEEKGEEQEEKVINRHEIRQLVLDNDMFAAERDELKCAMAVLQERIDTLRTENDGLVRARFASVGERQDLVTERDAAVSERDGLLTSRKEWERKTLKSRTDLEEAKGATMGNGTQSKGGDPVLSSQLDEYCKFLNEFSLS